MPCTNHSKVLLRVNAKRVRQEDEDVGTTQLGVSALPPLVRVRLDTIGPVPSILGGGADGSEVGLFRRLENTPAQLRTSAEESVVNSAVPQDNAGDAGRSLPVCRLVRGKDYFLIDCASSDPLAPGDESDLQQQQHPHHLYVLEVPPEAGSSNDEPESADDFGFDAFSFDTAPAQPPLPTLPPRRAPKRAPEDRSPEVSRVPLYYLAPSRRLEASGSSPFMPTAPSSKMSHWQFEEGDIATAQELFRAHAILTVCEDAQDVQADLYVYPDHRKDDEYDSNAEDFSGNDYPDDADQGDYADAVDDGGVDDGDAEDRARSTHPTRAARDDEYYGMYFEDDYVEPTLGRGWQSDDDDDGYGHY